MTPWRTVLPCCGLLLAGCGGAEIYNDSPYGRNDSAMIQMLNNTTVENAVIAQHTMFPYHFVVNSSVLNELGRRDLGILARHFLTAPGQVNVRRGDAPDELYELRVSNVMERMIAFGVDPERVAVTDALPGGSGMASEFVLDILGEGQPGAKGIGSMKATTPTITNEGDRNVGKKKSF
jgi:hypothetical protein